MREENYTNKDLQVYSCTLENLLNCNAQPIIGADNQNKLSGQLRIPEYQRPYLWKEKQIDQLLTDLLAHHEWQNNEKPMYYLGSILLHQQNGHLNIIDGQQRIVTALLINRFKESDFNSEIRFSSSISISNIQHNLSYLQAIQEDKIFDFRKDVFEKINYDSINVTLIVTNTEDLAYTFFETQNTGGVRLQGNHIIKAHHLRAIDNRKIIKHQARKWETTDDAIIEKLLSYLCKLRYWDNRKWRRFPFYRDEKGIKSVLVDEFTLKSKNTEDVSFYYSTVKKINGKLMQSHESEYRQIKQPLSNGENALNFINEYIELHKILFQKKESLYVDENFYKFRDEVLHGNNGTIFLKELLEMAIIAYVSRFGFNRIFESTLWLYRMIYSMRVSHQRNVREDSIFKFAYDNQLIDNILEVYTTDELIEFLKRFRYNFNRENAEPNKSKGKHIDTLQQYFNDIESVDYYRENPNDFDTDLTSAIGKKLKLNETT